MQIGIALVAFDRMSKVIGDACGKATQQFTQLQEKIKQTSERLAEIGTISYVGGQQILNAMQRPIDAFMQLEDASIQLKSTMMRDGGEIPKIFYAINKEAMELGNKLPGTTADFYRMASSLKALGVSGEAIAGGVLKAAAYLGVVLRPYGVTYAQAAEYTAKFREAMGVAEEDMIAFMDVIQRVAHTGVRVEELRYSFSKVAGTLKSLGIQGLEASKEIAPLIGTLIRTGRSGEEVGSGLGRIITAVLDVEKVSKVNSMLSQFGINLDFVDQETGKFKGVENMVAQLARLRDLSDVKKVAVFEELFGAGGHAALAKIIATEGIEGYNKQIDAMSRQADLNKRVETSLSSLRNMYEAFTGTLQNALAIFGESAAPTLKRFTELLNTLSARLGDFAENHKTLTKIITLGGLTIGGAMVVFGALGIALSIIFRVSSYAAAGIMRFAGFIKMSVGFIKMAIPWVRLKALEIWRLIGMQKLMNYISYHGGFWKAMQYWLMVTRYRILETTAALKAWIANLARVSFAYMISGLKTAAIAIKAFSLSAIAGIKAISIAMLTTPIGWMIMGIAALVGVGYMLYKHWDTVSKALSAAWNWLKESWKSLLNIFLWVNPITMPMMALNKLVQFVSGINLFSAGQKIISSLWEGIQSVAVKPIEAVSGIVGKIRNLLPFSPAKEGPFKDLHKVNIIGTIAETMKPTPAVTAMSKAMSATKQVLQPITQPVIQKLQAVKTFASPLIQPVFQKLHAVGDAIQPITQPVIQKLQAVKTFASPLIQPVFQKLHAVGDAIQPITQPVIQKLQREGRHPAPISGSVTVNYNPTVNINGASPQAKEDFTKMLKQHQHELMKLIQDAQAKNMRLAY